MAGRKRAGISNGKRWTFFYLNGDLHQTLETRRTDGLVIAWNYVEQKRVAYDLVDCYGRRQRAFTIGQVAKILGRHKETVRLQMNLGNIRKPQYITRVKDGEQEIGSYYFSEDDVRDAWEYFKTVHRGRPRKDGGTTVSNLISKAELEALLRNETILYAKTNEGEFVPVWRPPTW